MGNDDQLNARTTGLSILLVDDHRVFADVLAMRLRQVPHIDVVLLAFSLGAARAMINARPLDLVLLDYHLADELGLDLIADLERLDTPPAVLVVSSSQDTEEIINAIHSGADGWVMKDATFDVLLNATSEVLRGQTVLPASSLKPMIQQLLREARGPEGAPTFVDALSPRELEVLRCLVSGMSRSEVAARLYLSTNTVRTHVQHVLHRAGVHSTVALVAAARELGVEGMDDDATARPFIEMA